MYPQIVFKNDFNQEREYTKYAFTKIIKINDLASSDKIQYVCLRGFYRLLQL